MSGRRITTRKALIAIVSIVVALALVGWILITPQKPLLRVTFIGYTNTSIGERLGIFSLRNGHGYTVNYRTLVQVKTQSEWPQYPTGSVLPHPGPDNGLEPKASNRVMVSPPLLCQTWRLSVIYSQTETRRHRVLLAVAGFFEDIGMERLAHKIPVDRKGFHVFSLEVAQ